MTIDVEKYKKQIEADKLYLTALKYEEKKNIRKGKSRRATMQRKKSKTAGFGRTWKGDEVWFRVEFCWWDKETDEESNFSVPHWVCCQRIKGDERRILSGYFANKEEGLQLQERETIESVTTCLYVTYFLCSLNFGKKFECPIFCRLPKDFDPKINQAFIFAATSKGNDTIRDPIYMFRAEPAICAVLNKDIVPLLKKKIAHECE